MITFPEFGALRELVSSFNNSEQDIKEVRRLLCKIQAYSFEQVCCLFHQSDILTFLKNCLHYETSERLQSLSIEYLAILLLKIYLILYQKPLGINFDGYASSSESNSDIQRLKEDITDFVFEQLKFIFNVVVGESKLFTEETSEQTDLSLAAEKLVAVILQTYHGAIPFIQEHVDSVLGSNEFSQTHLILSHQLLLPHRSAVRHALHPIIDLLITTLFEPSKGSTRHLHHLIYVHDRAAKGLSYVSNGHTLDYLSHWMLFIQTALQEGSKSESCIINSSIILQFYDLSDPEKLKYKPLFLAEDDHHTTKDLTLQSREHRDAFVVLQDWIHSWIETSLLQIVKTSIHPVEKLQAIKTALQLIMNQVSVAPSVQLLASLFQQIISIFDEYELLNDEYDISRLMSEEELLVFLVDICSFLPQSFQFRFSDDISCWPLYQAIDRIGRYYERELRSNQLDQTSTIRCTRVVARWFIVVLQLLIIDGDYRLIGTVNEQRARPDSDLTSLLKLICQQLSRSGFSISPSASPTNFGFVFYATLLQCFGSFIAKLQELIRFVPLTIRTRLFPELHHDTIKGKEEMKHQSSVMDLLDTHDATHGQVDLVAKLRNLLLTTLSEFDSSEMRILSPFQKFQYFRNFPSIQSLAEYLKTSLLSKGLSPSSPELLLVSDEVISQLWESDLLSLMEINMALYDDFLATFTSFSSAMMLTNVNIDHGSQSLLFESIKQLSHFYLLPLQSQYKSYSPLEVSSFWQYYFVHHPFYRDEYLAHSSVFLSLLIKIVDQRLFAESKLASAFTFPLEDFIEEKESNSTVEEGNMLADVQYSLKDRLFEVLIVYIIPAVQDRALTSDLPEREEKTLHQLITHVISYVKQTIFYYSDHVDRWNLFKQLRSFSAQGILGGGGIQFASQSVSSVHEMRGLGKLKYFSNVVDHSNLHLQSLHSVVDSLRLVFEYFQQPTQQPIQGQGALFQSLLEAIFQQVIIPVENSFIFTEISLFLEQHPVFQHYLDQNKHQAQSYLNDSPNFVEEDQGTDSLADPQSAYHLLHRLLPAKETFYSMIQLYKSYFQNRLVFLSEQDNQHRTVVEVETDLLSTDNHLHRESSITTLLGSEDLKLLCRTSLDLKAIEVMISEYFLHFKQMNFHTDERFYLVHEVLEQHQILGLLTNYINILFFQNKEFFLHSTPQQQQTLIEGGSRRKSRNNSLLLDFNPITEDDSSKTQSDSLLLTVENIQHLVTREEQGGDNRICHLPPSSQMSEFLNNHYLPFHLNCGLFTRSVTEVKKQSPWVYFYSDHFLNVNDVISSFLPPLSLFLPVSTDPHSNSSRYDEETKETELFHLFKEVFFDEDELIYSQLSGPGDILTVLMAVTSFDPVTKRLKGRVRVINHSAFKIPYFSLSLLVQANMLLSNPTQHLHPASATNSAFHLFPPEHLHIHKENMGICASLESGDLLSAEYFPANAIIERDFNITWHFFAPFEIITRLEYTELSRNQDIYSNFPAINSQAVTNSHVPSTPSANRKQDFQRLVPCYLETNQGIDYQIFHNQYDLPASQQRNYLKYNAVIDMPPFHISIAYLLRAYANHQFCALSYWKLQQLHPNVFSRHRDMEVALFPFHSLIEELPREVVPGLLKVLGVEKMRAVHDFTLQWPFFQEQFLRLTDRYSHSCVIAVPVEVNDLPPTHNHLLLQTTLLRFFTNLQEELFRQPFNAISGELGAIGLDCISLHPQQRAMGWTLQTVWNDDVAVLVQFHPKRFQLQSTQSVSDIRIFDIDENEELSEEMFGRLQIRCGESHVLQAILIDLTAFINALSGGFFTLISEEQ